SNTCLRIVEKTKPVDFGACVDQLGLRSLFDDAFGSSQCANSLSKADGITDLNSSRIGTAGCHGLQILEAFAVSTIQGICAFCLGADEPRQPVNHAQVAHQQKTAADRRDVPQITARNDNEVRNLPAQLLNNFEADRLLTFNPKRIHGIRQIDRLVLRDLLNDLHATVEIRVNRKRDGAVGDGLNQLRYRNFIFWKKYDRRYSRCCAIR